MNITQRQHIISNVILGLIGLIVIFELVRDAMRAGDFVGYVNAGNAVLAGQNIYQDFLNTWPPFFSIFSILFAVGDRVSSFFIRFIWLLGSVASMYYVMQLSYQLILQKTIELRYKPGSILWQDTLVVIPLLISLRYLMDNLANVQINIYMLLAALFCFKCFIERRYALLGFVLALTISLKVYTIFLVFYFIYKRELKPVLWTLGFLLLINGISFIVFGYDTAIQYYAQWTQEIAPRSFIPHHKNQSVFGAVLRLFSADSPGIPYQINLLDIAPHTLKRCTYLLVSIAAIYPAYLFRNKLRDRLSKTAILEYSFIITAIPILSPLSWKAYFIFLWLPYLILYIYLYRAVTSLDLAIIKRLKYMYWTSIILLVFSTEALVGAYISDVLEVYSVITIGVILLLISILVLYRHVASFDLNKIDYYTRHVKNNLD